MRGTGLSDRDVPLSSEQLFVLDLEAVVDELRLDKFPLYGLCGGGRLALHYYSRHPARVSHLIFYGTDPEASGDERKKRRNVTHSVIQASWKVGSKLTIEGLMPYGGTREDIERLARWLQISVASDVAQKLIELRQDQSDLEPLLAKVSVPTLVIHRRGDHVPFVGGRGLAAKIRGARFLPLEGYNHLPATHEEAMELVTPVIEFLADHQSDSKFPSADVGVPLTYLFTEIEGPTVIEPRLGKKGFEKLLRIHTDTVRSIIQSYRGAEVKRSGGGIGASFFSASRAVGCALQIHHALAKRNAANREDAVKVRIGLNAGESAADDNAPLGTAQLARLICHRAEPSQILVSDGVRQLVAGKGFTFESAGIRRLKVLDEPLALYELHIG